MAGNTVVPLPSTGNTNTWSPNITQLGTGSNQLTINGSTGIISALTINATSLQEGGVDIDTLFVAKPWFGVYIVCTGTVSNSVGQKTVSVNKSGTGVYNLSWTGVIS